MLEHLLYFLGHGDSTNFFFHNLNVDGLKAVGG